MGAALHLRAAHACVLHALPTLLRIETNPLSRLKSGSPCPTSLPPCA
jgi:hypothetical protein